MPVPVVCDTDVRIETRACGLNFADLLMIRGTYQDTPPLPFTLGLELAGTIVEVGAGVKDLRVGDRVACYAGSGGLATQAVVPADRCVKIPDGVSTEAAAGLLITYGTSHLALVDRAAIRPGDRLLVTGAAGGVGKTAVEIGVALGADVTGIARGADKVARVRALGANAAFDSDDPNLTETLRGMDRFNIVYDAIGGDLFRTAMRCTAPEGRILAIGFASGDVPQIPANHVMVKNLIIHGLYWGGVLKYAPHKVFESLSQVFDLVAQGALDPQPDHIMTFDQADTALTMLKDRKTTGKVVITMPLPPA